MPEDVRIGVAEVRRRMDAGETIVFVDSRNPTAWGAAARKAPGALRVAVGEVAEKISRIPNGPLIVAYCT